MKQKKQYFLSILLVILFLTMTAFSMKIMVGMISIFEEFDVPNFLNRGALMFYCVLLLSFILYHKFDKSILGYGVFQFLVLFLLLNCMAGLSSNINSYDLLYSNLSLGLAILTYFVGFNLYSRSSRDSVILPYLAVLVTVGLCTEYYIISNTMRNDLNHTALMLGISYVPLILTPLLILNNNKLSWISFLLVGYVLIDSGKRGGIISLVFGLFSYYLCIKESIRNTKRIKIMLIIVLVVTLFWSLLFEFIDNAVFFDRLFHGSDDSDYSSGRLDIYSDTLSRYFDSDMWGMLLGHGLGSVAKVSKFGVTAHNDFIESLYDFGIVGFMSYLFFYISFIKQTFSISGQNRKMKGVFIYTLTLTFFLSTFSQIIVYQYLCLFTFAWGAISGARQQDSFSARIRYKNVI